MVEPARPCQFPIWPSKLAEVWLQWKYDFGSAKLFLQHDHLVHSTFLFAFLSFFFGGWVAFLWSDIDI